MDIGRRNLGFSFIEGMVVMTVFAIIITIAAGSWSNLIKSKRIQGAAESLHDTLKLAHSESIKNNSAISVVFQSGSNWCFALSDSGSCDCTTSNSCLIDGVERVVNSSDYSGNALSLTGLSNDSGIYYVEFEGTRGTALNTGTMTFSNSDYSVTVAIGKFGLVTICSDSIGWYGSC